MTRLALAALFLSTQALAQATARIESLDWMTGTWVNETARGKVAETWLGPGNGLMVAANLSTFANGRKSFEFLRIAQTPAGLSYFASPDGRAPTEFTLKEAGERRIVFENAAHDFPQRILYWREGDALMARIEGTIKGDNRQQEWRFNRAP